MDYAKIQEKVQKLLRLAQSDNPNEAALAAAKAQELIDKYKIVQLAFEEEDVESNEPIIDFTTQSPLDVGKGKNVINWKSYLANHISIANQCKIYHTYHRTADGTKSVIGLVGRPSDAETVRYLFHYLVNEIERLAKRDTRGYGKNYANNYRMGAVSTIGEVLRKQHDETVQQVKNENAHAIVLISSALAKIDQRAKEVQKFVKNNLNLQQRTVVQSPNYDGFKKGKEAAKEINLSKNKSLTGGEKKFLKG